MKARRSHIFPKAIDGHYVEPAWCAERLFEIESFGAPGALVLDPAAGWGTIPRAAIAAGYTVMASDLVDRLDRRGLDGVRFHICNFLEESPVRSAWSIVCNPHFDYIREFCERGLEIATYKVAMIMPLRRLPAARWLGLLPLETIYLLTPRPSMPPGEWIAAGNVPGGGRDDFCWLVFNKQANPIHPRLRWLARGLRVASRNTSRACSASGARGNTGTPPKEKQVMTSMRKYAGSSFIRLEDVKARPIRATILEVTEGDYGRPVLRLDSGQRFTVNATNMKTLIAAFGEDDADLINKRIELFAGFTKYQGNEQESVLVKAVSPGKGPAPKQERTKPSDDMDDLIPF